MNFLEKIGSVLLKFTQIIVGIGPVITSSEPSAAGAVNAIVSETEQLGSVITTVEAVGQALKLPGAQKLLAAAPLIAQVILKSGLMIGKTIADPVLFQQACTKIADGFADLLNSLHGNVDTTSKT
jgi:hypothetical protein